MDIELIYKQKTYIKNEKSNFAYYRVKSGVISKKECLTNHITPNSTCSNDKIISYHKPHHLLL